MPTWTHEQSIGNAGTDPSPTFGNSVQAGSLLIAMVTGNPTSYDAAGNLPTDSLGTTFEFIRKVEDAGNTIMSAWWWGIAPTSGANTITMAAATAFDAYLISEFSVDAGDIELDVETGQLNSAPGTGTDAFTSGAVTPNAADALLVGYASENGTAATLTQGTNFTEVGATNLEGFANNPVKIEHRTLASPASVAATWTQGANGTGNALIAVFIAVGGAATQAFRPDADIVTTGWTTAPLFSKVNEVSADGTVITATAS